MFLNHKYLSYFSPQKKKTSASSDNPATLGGTDDELKWSGYEVGIGYSIIPFLKINFDYRMINYDKYITAGNSFDLPYGAVEKLDEIEIFLSLSFPINL